ncbi:hypothetical protein NE237_004829 [Protea cynaroides]|uniref:BTB domain-containing protein n=1 Tax=Protea cynaroides TaxID=273540 RepID=A0A9Q0QTZ0_9MAGN|nr:hypothetical protein NE237_004829 [Protea cynaroides]
MAAENILKSREVSVMIKQGFIPDPSLCLFPSKMVSRVSPSSSPSKPSSNNPSPPPAFSDKLKSSPTLFEMMSESKRADDKRHEVQERVSRILAEAPFNNLNSGTVGDVKLTVSSKEGFRVSMNVHRRVLAGRSRFFAEKLGQDVAVSHSVEICDCDDVEVYVETLIMMYSDDLKKRLMNEEVRKVLSLLKVSAAIKFDAGIESCLEYLEAVPWSEDEEEKVISHLTQLQLHDSVTEVLQRISVEPTSSAQSDEIFMRLLTSVLQAKDDKARREMKTLIAGLLREDTTVHTASVDESRRDRGALMGEIAREADNMEWIAGILIEKKMADEFVRLWADQKELAILHSRIPSMYRLLSMITLLKDD